MKTACGSKRRSGARGCERKTARAAGVGSTPSVEFPLVIWVTSQQLDIGAFGSTGFTESMSSNVHSVFDLSLG